MKDHDKIHATFQNQSQILYSKHCSTATALLQVIDSRKSAVDKKQYTVAVFLDVRKAFDVINHDVLLAKLKSYGFGQSKSSR